MSGQHHHHSPLHNMSPAAHTILNLREMHLMHFDAWTTDYIHHFEPIMPPDWNVTDMDWNVYPHGRELLSGEKGGVLMTFAGPTRKIPHLKGDIQGNESFSLWMMTLPYSGRKISHAVQHYSEILGYTPTHAIYAYQHTTEIPSWPNWKLELIKLLCLSPKPVN